jgi:hypothetical protein
MRAPGQSYIKSVDQLEEIPDKKYFSFGLRSFQVEKYF